MRQRLYEKLGVDVTAIEGIDVLTGLVLLTEVGLNVSQFKSEAQFCSWLGLCPDNRISGGKVLSSRTRRVVNRASDALRMAASTLERSQSALGGFYRRMKARRGPRKGLRLRRTNWRELFTASSSTAKPTCVREWKIMRTNSARGG